MHDRSTSKLRRMASAVLWALALGVVSAPNLAAQVKLHPPPTPPTVGELVLTNTHADSVRIELRTGENSDCSRNTLIVTRALAPGGAWSITASDALCWRSVASGPVGATWGPWQRQVLAAGTPQRASP